MYCTCRIHCDLFSFYELVIVVTQESIILIHLTQVGSYEKTVTGSLENKCKRSLLNIVKWNEVLILQMEQMEQNKEIQQRQKCSLNVYSFFSIQFSHNRICFNYLGDKKNTSTLKYYVREKSRKWKIKTKFFAFAFLHRFFLLNHYVKKNISEA